MKTKEKGDIAEMAVATDLLKRGFKVAKPLGESWEYDLILYRNNNFERIEVKYTESNGDVLTVRARSHSILAGRITKTKIYTSDDIDWLVVYDKTTDKCYYIPSSTLTGAEQFTLRLSEPKKKYTRIRYAKDFMTI
jgi:hypothetical protein